MTHQWSGKGDSYDLCRLEQGRRFSLELGARVGAQVETLPAVRSGLLGRQQRTLFAEKPEPHDERNA